MLKSTEIPKEIDVVIAGGGTAGIVVASRLAKADPNLSILVLEHGPDVRDDPQVVHPALFITNILPNTKVATFYTSEPSEHLGGRKAVVPTGGCLGGGSSINLQLYVRPQAIDFDDWNTEGWTGEDMIPFFKKYENYQDTDPSIEKTFHGYGGELSISAGSNSQARFQEDFFKACSDIDINQAADLQDFKTSNAVGKLNKWVDKRDGFRQNVPHGFLYPILDAKNTGLQVATETKVVRIFFDDNTRRANGVEYVAEGPDGPQLQVVQARKQVILAAGALGSPLVLERSGVGNSSLLTKLDIPVISDLPGVGSRYHDHNLVLYTYKSSATKEETIDGLLSGRLTMEEAFVQKTTTPESYILGWSGLDCFGKLRPTEKQIETFTPLLKDLWKTDFENRPERPMVLLATLCGYLGDHSAVEPGQYFSFGPFTAYPYSQGSIHIKSSSLLDPPDFSPGYLSHPADVEQLLYGYKLQREIARRMSHYRGILDITNPKFPSESKASYDYVDSLSAEKGYPVPIEYSPEDDEVIRNFIRQRCETAWHSLGTCAMGKREQGGVVDERLNVHGVEGLKIVDLSICPKNVGANTYATALAIGEKAATIIAEDLGIKV